MASIYLKQVPEKTLKYILKIQGEIKCDKGISQYSLERTIYTMLEELQKITEKGNILNKSSIG